MPAFSRADVRCLEAGAPVLRQPRFWRFSDRRNRMIDIPGDEQISFLKVLGLSGLLLGGCATVVDAQAPAVPEYVIRPALQPSHRADLMYQVLLAELAGKRDHLDVALTNYRQAATASNDPGP